MFQHLVKERNVCKYVDLQAFDVIFFLEHVTKLKTFRIVHGEESNIMVTV